MGRPSKEFQIAKKTVEKMLILEELTSDSVLEAYQVLNDTMKDKSAGASTKVSCAKSVIDMYNMFYKKRKGTAEVTLEEFKAFGKRKEANESGDGKPLLSLKYGGE